MALQPNRNSLAKNLIPELWNEIFSCLEAVDLPRCMRTCQRWMMLIQSNPVLVSIVKHWGVYVLGGHCAGTSMSSVTRFRPGMNQWEPNATPMPWGLCHCAVAVCDRKIYVLGGRSGDERLDSCIRYNPVLEKWETLPPMRKKRSAAVAVVYGTSIYVMGGYDGRRETDSVERFDTVLSKWFYDCANMPCPISDAAAVAIDGSIYIIGGAKDCGMESEEVLKSCFRYTPRTNTWSRMKDMVVPRLFPAAVAVGRSIYVMAGVTPSDEGLYQGAYLRIEWIDGVEIYDVDKDTWRKGPTLLSKRQNPTAAYLRGQVFVCGGYCEEPLKSVEVLTVNKGRSSGWQQSISLKEKRDACRAVALI